MASNRVEMDCEERFGNNTQLVSNMDPSTSVTTINSAVKTEQTKIKIDNMNAIRAQLNKKTTLPLHEHRTETSSNSHIPTPIPRSSYPERNNNELVQSVEMEEESNWSSSEDSFDSEGPYSSSSNDEALSRFHHPKSEPSTVYLPGQNTYTSINDMISSKLLEADKLQKSSGNSRLPYISDDKVNIIHDGMNELSPMDIISLKVDQCYRDGFVVVADF